MNKKKEQDETKPDEPEKENRADYSSKDTALWRSLMEASPDFIIIVDGNENIEAINRVAPTMKMEEVLGTSVYNFIPPQYHDLHRQHIKKALKKGESGSFETQGVGPDGKVSAWYRTYIGPVKYDGKIESA
ncbi:PAS domain S-box protein, partial [candidate division WOR-3 bacterium]|nr:PAS domain S-box protein [candidate division WOR-3 bacterium]